MLSEDQALKIMRENVDNVNLQKHCIATQVVMKALARELGEDEQKWSITGLLHDLDYTRTADEPEQHSLIAAEMLSELDVPDDVVYAVKVHNEIHGLPRETLLDKALYAVDPLTGLIVAAVLVQPEKKIANLDVNSLLKRFREKAFAKGANREQIMTCEELGFNLEEFMNIALRSMQSVDSELGL